MIEFYPTLFCGGLGKYCQIETALLPVSSWAGYALQRQAKRGSPTDMVIGKIPVPKIPECMKHVFADCGGFVATFKWGGTYRYTKDQYVEWLDAVQPELAAMMDACCEDEITTGKVDVVQERQQFTTRMAYELWDEYKHKPWVWVPTIQGWTVADYIRHAHEMQPLIKEMKAFYQARGQGDLFRVGIGTLCARASATMIREVVLAVNACLKNIPLHLWGVKLSVMQSTVMLPEMVVSVDSAAWNGMWGKGREEWHHSGYTQLEWCFKVALPRYEAKIHAALTTLKQMSLEDIA